MRRLYQNGIQLFNQKLYQRRFFASGFKQTKVQQGKENILISNTMEGKTTCTERMLFYAGALENPGGMQVICLIILSEVHHGNTVMDYMEQERKRGITIRAATIAFNWYGHQINLIDTPGHVDFTAEVERSLRVCDGAVALFDAMQGVETQSETVWMQANKFKIPRLGFINKLDRQGSNIVTTLESIKRRLKVEPILVNVPSNDNNQLKGIIDLPSMMLYEYLDDKGKNVNIEEINKNHTLFNRTLEYRTQLIEQLANFDDELGDLYLSGVPIENLNQELIERAIRNSLMTQKSVALFCGSALKNKGIQPLLDAVIKYLPSPEDIVVKGVNQISQQEVTRTALKKEKLCALAFKVVNDKEKGLVTFFRVYSGSLKNKSRILNANLNKTERIQSLLRVRADEAQLLNEIGVGDIGAITGCKDIRSGDTLLEDLDEERIILEGVKMPPPVFFCSIEPENSRDQQELEGILFNLSREDPSISVKNDQETGQLLVSGLGELHLEILRDRIEIEYGIKSELGKMRVAYRESIAASSRGDLTLEKVIGGQNLYAHISMEIETTLGEVDFQELQKRKFDSMVYDENDKSAYQLSKDSFNLDIDTLESSNLVGNLAQNEITNVYEELESKSERVKLEGDEYEAKNKRQRDVATQATLEIYRSLDSLPIESKVSMQNAIEDCLQSGSLLGYPMVNVRVKILDGKWSNIRSRNPIIFQMGATQLLKQLIDEAQPTLLEPYMNVEISVPDHVVGMVLSDITGKRGGSVIGIRNVQAKFYDETDSNSNIVDEKKKCVNTLIPLSEMVGYTTYLRSSTKGEGQFVMNFSHYEKCAGQKQDEVLNNPYDF
ncbi:translation elongation factor g [Stylonychia lemnae]|uniref:Translation elongation factor g n=1 Tax=Stylonychia lemnae TaxID=5949 RepID=A0A078AVG9_STYLE|nr:translation elongation factor g [Stylonychia lemnae]|eukprot:CDW86051.1 translation elongation factor g [Stylonychia lemnae]